MIIDNDQWWSKMMDNNWQYLLNQWLLTKIDNDCWWLMISMTINDDQQWSIMIDDDQQSMTMIADDW